MAAATHTHKATRVTTAKDSGQDRCYTLQFCQIQVRFWRVFPLLYAKVCCESGSFACPWARSHTLCSACCCEHQILWLPVQVGRHSFHTWSMSSIGILAAMCKVQCYSVAGYRTGWFVIQHQSMIFMYSFVGL